MILSGNITTLITPFTEKKSGEIVVDYRSLENLILWQLEANVSGFLLCAATGEASTMSLKDYKSIVSFAEEIVGDKLPLVVGGGTNNTVETIAKINLIAENGADAVLLTTPYFNIPSQEGIVAHYEAIAEVSPLPIVLYNTPARTSINLSFEALTILANHPNIIGIKDCSADPVFLTRVSSIVSDSFALYAGLDNLVYITMALGGSGAMSTSGNVIPERIGEIVESALVGNYEHALDVQTNIMEIVDALFMETNPSPVKAALNMMGIIESSAVRLPLVEVSLETAEVLESIFSP